MIASEVAISIVLPVPGGAKHLDECLASVFAQTFPSFELLAADCGTASDDTRAARVTDPRLRWLPSVPERSVIATLNRLVAEARGAVVHLLRPEDRLAPDCLAEVQRFLATRPEAAFVASKAQLIDDDGRVVGGSPLGDLPEVLPSTHVLQRLFYEGCFPGSPSAVAIRRRVLESVGLFDETYGAAADYEMWTRVGFRGGLGILHRHLVQVRRASAADVGSDLGSDLAEQRRRVRASLVPLLPGPIQGYAREFETRRHFVADFDAALSSLFAGRPRELLRVARALGIGDLSRAGLRWLLTANNRVLRPTPRYLLPRHESSLRRAS